MEGSSLITYFLRCTKLSKWHVISSYEYVFQCSITSVIIITEKKFFLLTFVLERKVPEKEKERDKSSLTKEQNQPGIRNFLSASSNVRRQWGKRHPGAEGK